MTAQAQRAPAGTIDDEALDSVAQAIDKLTLKPPREGDRRAPRPRAPPQAFRHVVACYDATPGAEQALEWAEHVARIGDARTTLLSVAPVPQSAPQAGWTVGWIPDIADEMARMQRAMQRAAESAASVAREEGHKVDTVVTTGGAIHEIVAFVKAHAPDLVVVGSRGRGPVARVLLGSVAQGVLNRAPATVLVARGEPPPRRVLIATDGSTASLDATAVGLRYAAAAGADVVVLHVVDYEGDPAKVPAQGFLKEVVEKMDLPRSPRITYALGTVACPP